MDPIYRKSFSVAAFQVDPYQRLKPSALLAMVQEAAGNHCVEYHAGRDVLSRQNLFWAVTRHRVQITRLPVEGETLTVETWPMPTTKAAYPRSVVAYDSRGQELFRAISLWVLMDSETRAMVVPGKSGVAVAGTLTGSELAVPRPLTPMVLRNSSLRTVRYSELDVNGHLNNTRYLDWVEDLLPSGFHREHPVQEFTVCYLSEAREEQQLTLDWELLEGPSLRVEAHRQSPDGPAGQERVFSAQVYY